MALKTEITKLYLDKRGVRLEIDDIKNYNGVIAIVDIIGGFYSFKNIGLEPCLTSRIYYLKDPKMFYCAEITKRGEIDVGSEGWYLIHESKKEWVRRRMLNMSALSRGIYKLNSEDLKKRIEKVMADINKKLISIDNITE